MFVLILSVVFILANAMGYPQQSCIKRELKCGSNCHKYSSSGFGSTNRSLNYMVCCQICKSFAGALKECPAGMHCSYKKETCAGSPLKTLDRLDITDSNYCQTRCRKEQC